MTNYITKGIGGFYYVKTETGIVECRARGIFRKRGITPVAGDQVVLSADRTTIDEILPRKNVFIRPPVANLDVLFIVASTTQPVPSTLILDELTAAAVYKDVQPVIVITKADLAAADALEKAYADSTIPLIRLDYDTGEGLDQIRARIAGNLCAFCGNSGVGKSTLLNALAPQLERQTGGISQKLGRGRHTTREVEIFEVCGGLLADTPVLPAWMPTRFAAFRRKSCSMLSRNLSRILGNAVLPAAPTAAKKAVRCARLWKRASFRIHAIRAT